LYLFKYLIAVNNIMYAKQYIISIWLLLLCKWWKYIYYAFTWLLAVILKSIF